MRVHPLSLTATAIVLAACTDSPLQPPAAPPTTVSAAIAAAGAARHVVEFNGPVRKDFAGRVAALGGTVDFVAQGAGFAGVSGLSASAAASLSRHAGVSSVYADVEVHVAPQTSLDPVEAADVEASSIANPAASFLFALQWNMRAINAHTAWAQGHLGSPRVTAAILDSGIDYDGFDMNGMVDLARSASFVSSDTPIINAFFPGRHPIDDLNGHGTNVATQVSTNGTIFAGVSTKTRLIGVKVLGFNGSGTVAGILAGIEWAAAQGADVANLSVGIRNGVDKVGGGSFIGLTNKVFNAAHRAGMVMVVAAGNDGLDLDGSGRNFAAYCEAPHVICVSALGPTSSTNPLTGPWFNVDAHASYSNIGQAVTVSAPGGTAAGFVRSVCARHLLAVVGGFATFPCNVAPPFLFHIGMAGTSQAAPHVTGLVAQLIAKYGKGKPSQIKQLLLNGVDDLGPPGADPVYGAGRINVAKALSQ